MRPYVVRQGEHLAQLAAHFGFDADDVWEHPDNRELRDARPSRHVLAPGDILHIPDEPPPPITVTHASSNRYRGSQPRAPVTLRLELSGQPLANEACLVRGLGDPLQEQTDSSGTLSFEAPLGVRDVRIEVVNRKLSFGVRIGHLDPHTTDTGIFERLVNLGFIAPEGRLATGDERRARVSRALVAFQRAEGLEETGELDDRTRAALSDRHGC